LKTKIIRHKVGIVSLGCAKNLVDTEVLMRQLDASQFTLILDPTEKDRIDTAIINTCGFILDAKNESIDTILRFTDARKNNRLKHLFVMGCLSQRYMEQLKAEIPEVDGFYGVNDLKKIMAAIGGNYRADLLGERMITTPSHYAYLKIAEGCDRKCSFCAIPAIRGRHVSRPVEEIVREAEFLAGQGVKELNVISQDTTYYGLDLYKKRMLPELLSRLASIKKIEWIRVHYTYPDGFPPELLEVIRNNGKICRYIDIPLQHINDRILKSMRRGIGSAETRKLVGKIRESIPGAAIRTSMIVGYPGETEKEFSELKDFIRESEFDRLGVFTYSNEEGTDAFRLKDDIPARVKDQRAAEIMEIQQEISAGLNGRKMGMIMKTLIDRKEGDYFAGRTEFDSPEVDNEVLIPASANHLEIGQFYNIRITSTDPFDLYGELLIN
jgi:ribosomal protein S12 methylthiotransferase